MVLSLFLWNLDAQEVHDTLLEKQLDEVMVVSSRLPVGMMESSRMIYYQRLSSVNQGNQGLALDEGLQHIPGVYVLDALNFSQDVRIAIRGFGSRAAFGVRGIKVLIDGVPATTPDGQTQLDQLDVQSIDNVEVMTGAVGGLYGNASGGAISLQTKLPDHSGAKIGTTIGSYGLLRNSVDLSMVKNKWVFELGANRTAVDGYREYSGAKTMNLNARVTWKRDKDQWQVLGQYTDSPWAEDAGGVNLDAVREDRRKARPQNVQFGAGERISQSMGALNYKREISASQTIEAKGYYIGRNFTNLLPFESGGAVSFDRGFGGVNGQYTLDKSNYRLLIGVESERQKDARERHDNLEGEIGALIVDQDEIFGMLGVYVLQDIQLNANWSLDASVRMDFLKVEAVDQFLGDGDDAGEIKWDHLSPSLGVNYHLGKQQYLVASAGHSFETPALSELSNNPDGSGGFNLDLSPQQANHYELGWKGRSGLWGYQLSAFHIDLQNELLPFEIENFPGRTFYRNAGTSDRTGLELAWNGMIAKHLKLLGSFTYSDFSFADYQVGEDDFSGNQLSGIPKYFGSLGLIYEGAQGAFFATDFLSTGKLYADDANATSVEGYGLLHLRGGWKFDFNRTNLKVHFGIKNATNTSYYDNIRINAFGGRFYEPAPGRQYFGGFVFEI